MENRRRDYRHRLAGPARVSAELTAASLSAPARGDVVDLSVTGMAIQIDSTVGPLDAGTPCVVHLVVANQRIDLTLPSVVVHHREGPAARTYGLHFPPLASAVANDNRERVLWRFLLEEQRQQRRQVAENRRSAG